MVRLMDQQIEKPHLTEEDLQLVIQAIYAVNRLAHSFDDERRVRRRVFESKNDLISLLLELEIPGVEPSWERQENGDYMLVISIGHRFSPHCPFERLSPAAQCKVVQRIGPAPV